VTQPPGPATALLAAQVVQLLTAAGRTVGTAESLTGGLVAAAISTVPGASAVLRGGVVAYAPDVKASLLGVPAALLRQRGAVDPDVAAAMATGARLALGATFGVATTGVAGPDPSDGKPVGTVHVAVSGPAAGARRELRLSGSRAEIRAAAVRDALQLLVRLIQEQTG
jgi:nicotinamide-nucleotide amidase